jgi:lysophospholipase L1-like esterase
MRQEIYDAMPERKGEIIFLGNSITERINWSELFNNGKIINRGIGGDICWGVYNRLNEVLASKPKQIFLLIGINDIGRGIPTQVITNKYDDILKTIKNNSPKTKVVLQTVIPINENTIWYDYMKGKSPKIIELNSEIKKLAVKNKLPLIDLYNAFVGDDGFLIKEYTSDGLHLNGKGYLQWVEVIKKSNIKIK